MNIHTQTATARRRGDYTQDIRYAYLEWLRFEARLLQIELMPVADPEAEYSPMGTFAAKFHHDAWADPKAVPQPSSRALAVLEAAGVKIPAKARRAAR